MGKASYAMFILHIPLLWWAVSWGFPYAPEAYVAMVLLVAAIVLMTLPLARKLTRVLSAVAHDLRSQTAREVL